MINKYNLIKKEIAVIEELLLCCKNGLEETESDFVKSEIEQDIKKLEEDKAKLLVRLRKISSF